MKTNHKIWVLIAVLVCITISITLGTLPGQTQQSSSGNQNSRRQVDLSKYPIADLVTAESANIAGREDRVLKNKRYDKHAMVLLNPGPTDTLVKTYDAEPIPPALPREESKLIVVGTVVGSKAFISNDKSGVYCEYSFQVESIIKNDKTKNVQAGESIIVDRSGGFVRYPNGQTVLYLNAWQDLPELNGRYVVFLDKKGDENDPNYRIITAYELKDNQVTPLDRASSFDEFKAMEKGSFIKRIVTPN